MVDKPAESEGILAEEDRHKCLQEPTCVCGSAGLADLLADLEGQLPYETHTRVRMMLEFIVRRLRKIRGAK